jgi:hypothetical protein
VTVASPLASAHAFAAAVAQPEGGISTTLAAASSAGDTNIKVTSVTGLLVGASLTVDMGANAENRTIVAVGTPGSAGTGVTVVPALISAHASAAAVTQLGSVITFTAPLASAHASGAALLQLGTGVTLAAPLTLAHANGATVVQLGSGITFAAPLSFAHAKGTTISGIVPPVITNVPISASVGSPYDFQFTDGASPAATYKLVTGGITPHPLPPGLSLSGSGEISGTPSAVGRWKFSVKATNLAGTTTKHTSITVQAVNLVLNGGFEKPQVDGGIREFGTAERIGAWAVGTGSVDVVGKSIVQAAKGKQSLDLNGSGPGAITQRLSLPYDASYQISFLLAGNPGCGDELMPFQVWWNGIAVLDGKFDTTGHTPDSPGWLTTLITVTAGTGPATLAFTSNTAGSCGPALDSIAVTQLP